MVIAVIGASALYLLFGWLLSSILASLYSEAKGYGDRIGLASGLILNPVGVLIWLLAPPKPDSDWVVVGPRPVVRIATWIVTIVGFLAGILAIVALFTSDDASVVALIAGAVIALGIGVGGVLTLAAAGEGPKDETAVAPLA